VWREAGRDRPIAWHTPVPAAFRSSTSENRFDEVLEIAGAKVALAVARRTTASSIRFIGRDWLS